MPEQVYLEDLEVGATLGPVEFGPVRLKHLVKWAAASGDFHEIHYDREYALAQGLPDVVVHGPLKLALMGRLLMALAGPRGWIRRMKCRYVAFDLPGTVLRCRATVAAIDPERGEVDLDVEVTNEKGASTATGTARVQLPRRPAPQELCAACPGLTIDARRRNLRSRQAAGQRTEREV